MPNNNHNPILRQAMRLVLLYLALVLAGTLAKPLFVLAQPAAVSGSTDWSGIGQAMLHGLLLDVATAGYLIAPVWLLCGLGLWVRLRGWRVAYKVWAAVVGAALALVLVGDACLYGFWHTKLDATVWNYLAQPEGALQSVSMGYALCATLAVVAVAVLLYYLQVLTFVPRRKAAHAPGRKGATRRTRGWWTAAWLVTGGLIFLGIRGGVGKGTANVGMVYFSPNAFLNHTAVNPAFCLISSTLKAGDYGRQAHFFSHDERKRIYSMLGYNTESLDTEPLLNTTRPNVLIILMEGCGGTFVNAVDPKSDPRITPNLNRLAHEGVVFTQAYANSYRTDRGTVCALSGFPSFPDLSVMKMPSRCEHLPSIASSLKGAGYATAYLYGGDANFTNMRGYLQSTGYDRIEGDESFPVAVRRTHNWGVTDAIAFDTLYQRIMRLPQGRPWHVTFQTLASHEPWIVPYNRIKGDKVANSMAYLDHCIGTFISRLRQSALWRNTLVVMLPDHGVNYPEGISDADERRSHIPIIMAGGALKGPRVVTQICNQTDLAATLLGQLQLPHKQFGMSRDVLSRTYTHPSAVHTWQEGTYYMDNSGISVVNLLTQPASVMREAPHASQQRVNAAKALLQTAYDHFRGL